MSTDCTSSYIKVSGTDWKFLWIAELRWRLRKWWGIFTGAPPVIGMYNSFLPSRSVSHRSVLCLLHEMWSGRRWGGCQYSGSLGEEEDRSLEVPRQSSPALPSLQWESLFLLSSGPDVPLTRTSLVNVSRGPVWGWVGQGSHQLWDISLTLLYTNFQISPSFQPGNT